MSPQKILEVTEVSAKVLAAAKLEIHAKGKAPNPAWQDFQLIPTANPPKDGRLHYDFVGTEKDGGVIQKIVDAEAKTEVIAPVSLKKSVVHALKNEKECALPDVIDRP